MYFVREPSQAQSSDKIDVDIAALIEKATKQREQLDKLELAFNEARGVFRASWKDPRVSLHAITATGLALQRVILRCSKSCFKQQGQSETAISKVGPLSALTLLTVQESAMPPARNTIPRERGL